jgi:hypothetical protein
MKLIMQLSPASCTASLVGQTLSVRVSLTATAQVSHPYKHQVTLYSAFTHKVQRNCHFPAPSRNCYNKVSWFYCSYGAILDSYRENIVALGGESCSSSREPGSDSCVQLYQWTHCTCAYIHLQVYI